MDDLLTQGTNLTSVNTINFNAAIMINETYYYGEKKIARTFIKIILNAHWITDCNNYLENT